MSITAPALAIRNLLRSNLTDFYDQTSAEEDANDLLAGQIKRRKASIKCMPDERPAPNCGREFISVFSSNWEIIDQQGGDANQHGFHERTTVTVALTHRYGDVPFDRLGEAAYMADEDVFVQQYMSISDRIRQIAILIHSSYTGFQTEMSALLDTVDGNYQLPYDKMYFIGADAKPEIVGPDHFHATESSKSPSGLMMRANFRGSSRLHNFSTLGLVT